MTPFELTLARAAFEARFADRREHDRERWEDQPDYVREIWSRVALAVARPVIKAALVECEAVRARHDAQGITFEVGAARSIAKGIEGLIMMEEGAQ